MECRQLEVSVISADGLKDLKLFGKMQTHVVAWINPHVRLSTKVKKGGVNPVWNEKLAFDVPEQLFHRPDSYLTMEIFSLGSASDKSVGLVSIPLADILRGPTGGTKEQPYTSYQVRRRSGSFHGLLNLSFRLGEKRTVEGVEPPPPAYEAGSSYGQPVTAYPAYPPGYGAGTQQPAAYPPQNYPQYPPQQYPPQQPPPRRNRFNTGGMGFGTGLLGGALGGLLLGDLISDASYDNGYGDGFDAGGGFDGGFDGGGF